MVLSKPTRLVHWPGTTQSRALRMRTVTLLAGSSSTSRKRGLSLMVLAPCGGEKSLRELGEAVEVELLDPLFAVGLGEDRRRGCGAHLDLEAVGHQDGGFQGTVR